LKKYLTYLAVLVIGIAVVAATPADKSKTFSVTADTIEGCSCPLFCTCYFGPSADEHMCTFTNVYKFRPGSHYGNVDLSNQLVWVNGDLVNDGFNCTADRGALALQSEGSEVEFRRVEIGPLPAGK